MSQAMIKPTSPLSKTCPVCSIEFTAERVTAKYCGRECKDRSTNGMRGALKAASAQPQRPRGRTARCKQNPIAPLLRAMNQSLEVSFETHEDGTASTQLIRHPDPHWFDDFIMGACYISMIDDHGRLDVSPGDIRKLCKLDEISVKGVQSLIWNHQILPVSKRHAQRLVKVAVIALNGIEMYLDRNPAIKAKLTLLSKSGADEYERESAKIDHQFFAEWEEQKAKAGHI